MIAASLAKLFASHTLPSCGRHMVTDPIVTVSYIGRVFVPDVFSIGTADRAYGMFALRKAKHWITRGHGKSRGYAGV